jgi:hypothetical protein
MKICCARCPTIRPSSKQRARNEAEPAHWLVHSVGVRDLPRGEAERRHNAPDGSLTNRRKSRHGAGPAASVTGTLCAPTLIPIRRSDRRRVMTTRAPGERWQRHARRGHPPPRAASAFARSSAEGASRIASRRDRPRAWSSSRIECKDQPCADSGAAFVQAAAFETSMAAGPRWSRTPVPLRIGQCRDDRVAASMEPPSMGYIRPRKRGRAPICLHPIFLPRPATRVGCCGSAYFQKSRPGSRRKRTDASCGSP